MTALSVALLNLKPGTGKTTSAVWLAHIFAQAGKRVLLVDADPSGSALAWSDLAAMDPRLPPRTAFRFRIVALPSRGLHPRAHAREALEGLGYDVLRTAVPRLEVYAQSFGMPVPETGRDVWRGVAHDLIERCVPLGKVPS